MVKLGNKRATFNIPNHYRIIQPDILINLGILLKENRIRWNKDISYEMRTRGMEGDVEKILPAVEIVIIDTDFIYPEAKAPIIDS